MFCPECGIKNTEDSKFCFNCGYDLKGISYDSAIKESKVSLSKYDRTLKFSNFIKEKLIESHTKTKSLDMKALYLRAEYYEINPQQVDQIVGEVENSLERVSQFIEQILKESEGFLVSEKELKDIISFCEGLGFEENEVMNFLEYYVKINKFGEKRRYLTLLLDNYVEEGEIEKEWDIETDYGILEVEADELVEHLKNDILEIDEKLKQFYEKSENHSLTDTQYKQLKKWFIKKQYPVDYLDDIIEWFEINSGIKDRRIYEKVNKYFDIDIIYEILGYEVRYGGEYFFERYLSSCISNFCKDVEQGYQDLYNKARQERLVAFAEIVLKANNEAVDFINRLNKTFELELPDDVYVELNQYCANKLEEIKIGFDKLNQIDTEEAIKKGYREIRKETRGRWQGGGFGVSGALKGAITAGAMNAVGGMAHSAFNALGNLGTGISADSARKEIVRYFNDISEDLKKIFIQMRDELIKEIKEICPKVIKWGDPSLEKTLTFEFTNLNDRRRKEVAVQLLQLNPYSVQNYIRIFEFDSIITKNDFRNLVNIAKRCGIDLEKELLSYYEAQMEKGDMDISFLRKLTCIICMLYKDGQEEFEKRIYEKIRRILEYQSLDEYGYNIKELLEYDMLYPKIKFKSQYQKVIDKKIEEIEEKINKKDRTVKRKIEYLRIDKDLATDIQIQEIDTLIRQNEKLQKTVYDITSNYKTGLKEKSKLSYSEEGTEFDDIGRAKNINNEIEQIIDIYQKCNIENYDSIKKAVETISVICGKIEYGKRVLEELQIRLQILDIKERTVYDIESTYQRGTQEKSKLTFGKVGKQYETIKEAVALRCEISTIFDLYSKCEINDYNSVKQTKYQVSEIYKKTNLGKCVFDELQFRFIDLENKQKIEYENKRRTVAGVVLKTFEEAEIARKEEKVIKEIEEQYSEIFGIDKKIEMLKKSKGMQFETDVWTKWTASLEQDIIKEYNRLQHKISMGVKCGIGSILFLCIALALTFVGITFVITGGIIIKIIAVVIVFRIWSFELGLIGSWLESRIDKKNLKKMKSIFKIRNNKLIFYK